MPIPIIPEDKRLYLDHDDTWHCQRCGEGNGLYLDLQTPWSDGARCLRCAVCSTIDSLLPRTDVEAILGCLPEEDGQRDTSE